MFHNKDAIGEEGNEKPPHKIHCPSLVSATLEIEYEMQFMPHLKSRLLERVLLTYGCAKSCGCAGTCDLSTLEISEAMISHSLVWCGEKFT